MTPTNAPGLRAVVEKFLRDNDPEGFGCACEPGRLCGPCMWTKRTEPLRAALATPPIAVQPATPRDEWPEDADYALGHLAGTVFGLIPSDEIGHCVGLISAALASSPAVQAVPEGWRLVQDATVEERSWPEDSTHENGNYWNDCCHCQRMFIGHKRRVVCKSCASAPQAPAPEPKPDLVHPSTTALEVHATLSESDGLPLTQEPKYTVNGSAIVNRASGESIPADEPAFIFRARDVHAREALEAYACLLMPGDHRDAVAQRVADFAAFSYAHPERMKEPDTAPADSSQQGCVPAATAARSDVQDEKGES